MAAVAAVAVMLLVGALWNLASLCQRVADAEWERDELLRERDALRAALAAHRSP